MRGKLHLSLLFEKLPGGAAWRGPLCTLPRKRVDLQSIKRLFKIQGSFPFDVLLFLYTNKNEPENDTTYKLY